MSERFNNQAGGEQNLQNQTPRPLSQEAWGGGGQYGYRNSEPGMFGQVNPSAPPIGDQSGIYNQSYPGQYPASPGAGNPGDNSPIGPTATNPINVNENGWQPNPAFPGFNPAPSAQTPQDQPSTKQPSQTDHNTADKKATKSNGDNMLKDAGIATLLGGAGAATATAWNGASLAPSLAELRPALYGALAAGGEATFDSALTHLTGNKLFRPTAAESRMTGGIVSLPMPVQDKAVAVGAAWLSGRILNYNDEHPHSLLGEGTAGLAGGLVGGIASRALGRELISGGFAPIERGALAAGGVAVVDHELNNIFGKSIGGHQLFRPVALETIGIGAAVAAPVDPEMKLGLVGAAWLGGRVWNYFKH